MRETHAVDPVAVSAILSASRRTVTVRIGGLGSRGLWRAPTPGALGFEVLGADELWHSTPIVGSGADSVTVGPAPRGARAARYLFYASPCGLECYQCPVYGGAAARESQRRAAGLPAPGTIRHEDQLTAVVGNEAIGDHCDGE